MVTKTTFGVILCLGEIVAIKKSTASEGDEPFSRTSVREVKILRTMRHRNIVDLKEAFKRYFELQSLFWMLLGMGSCSWCLNL